ncbi:hypothetical protein ACFL5V_07035 [Fibrobacterota bacterium]
MKRYFFSIFLACAWIFAGIAAAEENEELDIDIEGWAAFRVIHMPEYRWFGREEDPQTYNNTAAGVGLHVNLNPFTTVKTLIEASYGYNTHPYTMLAQYQPGMMETGIYPYESQVVFDISEENFSGINDGVFKFELAAGLFPYKYNPEVRNLGEYLFRSGTYPGWLVTNFDWPVAQLTGLRLSSTAFNSWQNDLLLTTEMKYYPFYDLSYTWITSYKIGKVIDIGGGICLARYTPMSSKLTTRKIDDVNRPTNFYLENIVMNADTIPGAAGAPDTINYTSVASADTAGYYTFTGTKLMGRITLDLKHLLGSAVDLFAETDGKLYAEVNVLALENQGWYYDDVKERMPISFGFNIPTFKLLDVLSFEMEHYDSPYPNSYGNQVLFILPPNGGTPTPYFALENGSSWEYRPIRGTPYSLGEGENWKRYKTDDNWKWSLYAKRTFADHFAVVFQAARDHWRSSSNSNSKRDYEEGLPFNGNWYWGLKTVTYF